MFSLNFWEDFRNEIKPCLCVGKLNVLGFSEKSVEHLSMVASTLNCHLLFTATTLKNYLTWQSRLFCIVPIDLLNVPELSQQGMAI